MTWITIEDAKRLVRLAHCTVLKQDEVDAVLGVIDNLERAHALQGGWGDEDVPPDVCPACGAELAPDGGCWHCEERAARGAGPAVLTVGPRVTLPASPVGQCRTCARFEACKTRVLAGEPFTCEWVPAMVVAR